MTKKPCYSKKLINAFTNPKNIGKMKNPTVQATYQSPVCGDALTIYLKVKNNKIIKASFQTWGCMVATGTGSLICQLATGKTIAQAKKINKKDIEQAIGQIPPIKQHCLDMALKTLNQAIDKY